MYSHEDMTRITAEIRDLINTMEAFKDAGGFFGGMFCGYLRALNDVQLILVREGIAKSVDLQRQIAKDIVEIQNKINGATGEPRVL